MLSLLSHTSLLAVSFCVFHAHSCPVAMVPSVLSAWNTLPDFAHGLSSPQPSEKAFPLFPVPFLIDHTVFIHPCSVATRAGTWWWFLLLFVWVFCLFAFIFCISILFPRPEQYSVIICRMTKLHILSKFLNGRMTAFTGQRIFLNLPIVETYKTIITLPHRLSVSCHRISALLMGNIWCRSIFMSQGALCLLAVVPTRKLWMPFWHVAAGSKRSVWQPSFT